MLFLSLNCLVQFLSPRPRPRARVQVGGPATNGVPTHYSAFLPPNSEQLPIVTLLVPARSPIALPCGKKDYLSLLSFSSTTHSASPSFQGDISFVERLAAPDAARSQISFLFSFLFLPHSTTYTLLITRFEVNADTTCGEPALMSASSRAARLERLYHHKTPGTAAIHTKMLVACILLTNQATPTQTAIALEPGAKRMSVASTSRTL